MSDDLYKDLLGKYARFHAVGEMGVVQGWANIRMYRMQTARQVEFVELASKAMAAERQFLHQMVLTVTARVEARASIHGLIQQYEQVISGEPAPQLPAAPVSQIAAPGSGQAHKAMETYTSSQVIEDEALSAAIGCNSAGTDKAAFWSDWEKRMQAKQYSTGVIDEIRHIANEVIRRVRD